MEWFSLSKSLWTSVLSKVVSRSCKRKVPDELKTAWDMRLNVLLQMTDEVCTEKDRMKMAMKIERATKQRVTTGRDTNKVLDIASSVNNDGDLIGTAVGPLSIYLRSKVEHPNVIKILSFVLGRYLNGVIVEYSDRNPFNTRIRYSYYSLKLQLMHKLIMSGIA